MRINEIERIYAKDYSGYDTLGTASNWGVSKSIPLPGESGLTYSVKRWSKKPTLGLDILILDKKDVVGSLSVKKVYGLPFSAYMEDTIDVVKSWRGKGISKALHGIVLVVLKAALLSGEQHTPASRRTWVGLSTFPGIDVTGYVVVPDEFFDKDEFNSRDTLPDRVMHQLMEKGVEYIGKDHDNHWFSYPVVPGTGEMVDAVKTSLIKLYTNTNVYFDTGLIARWTGK